MVVRHDGEHRVAGFHPVAAALVLEIAGAGDGVLEHREGHLPAPAAAPVVARAGADFVAGGGRHGVQAVPSARQGNRRHDGGMTRQPAEHGITHRSTNSLYDGAHATLILGRQKPRRRESKISTPLVSCAGGCGGLKIAIIGAGSVGFTKKLVTDILCVPELREVEFALTDISEHNLGMVRRILERMIEANALPTRISATTDRRMALDGADYVINCVRIGGLEAFADDIRIPLKYGIDQCVGDTLCAGGILYGQRTIPALLDFCRDMREVAAPGARLLNYANPMAMNVWAAIDHGGVDVIGLCHGIQHGGEQIADAARRAEPGELDFVCAGINHQTWYIDVRLRGRPVGRDELLEAFERHPVYSKQEKVRIDVLKRFGFYSTECNGHLSEYLPWYRKRPGRNRPLDRHVGLDPRRDGRLSAPLHRDAELVRDRLSRASSRKPAARSSRRSRSTEHASYIIEALETGRTYRGHFNVRNEA